MGIRSAFGSGGRLVLQQPLLFGVAAAVAVVSGVVYPAHVAYFRELRDRYAANHPDVPNAGEGPTGAGPDGGSGDDRSSLLVEDDATTDPSDPSDRSEPSDPGDRR